MDKKIKLGINLFFNNSNNSGIVNYIYNIVSALKTLPLHQQPEITIFHSADAPIDYVKSIGYPDVKFLLFKVYPSSKPVRLFFRVLKKITNQNYFVKFQYLRNIDVLYPYFGFNDQLFEPVKHKIYWLVDFNNRAYPDHYADNGKSMFEFQKQLTSTKNHIVLSSNALFDELKQYYPHFNNKVSILNFACSLPDTDNINFNDLKKKFGIEGHYMMSPNQFWEHKNQLTLIEALRILKAEGKLTFEVVFTGSTAVNRGKGHMLEKLQQLIDKYELRDKVKFLGIVERNEQLALMKHADGLVQPSLYEGWSTLVEEAKALNQYLALSDLPVHREQNCPNAYFFSPLDPQQLAESLLTIMSKPAKRIIDYNDNVHKFGADILNILKNELSE